MSTFPSEIRTLVAHHLAQHEVPAEDAAEFAAWLATAYEPLAGGWQY